MTLGRPLEFDPERALDAAVEVFWRKGYEATSMADLLDAMGLSKSSLYQAFGGKKQLFERCLGRYTETLSRRMREALRDAPSGRRFLEDTFQAVVRTARRPDGAKGCLISNTASELGQRDPLLALPVAEGLRCFAGVFVAAVARAQGEGEVRRDTDPETAGQYLLGAMNGLRTMIKAGADLRVAQGMVSLTLRALD